MSDDFTAEDIRQMAAQGDLKAFLRSRIQRPKDGSEHKTDFPAAAPPQSREAGRPAGAWPAGAHWPGCTSFGPTDGTCPCGAGTVRD